MLSKLFKSSHDTDYPFISPEVTILQPVESSSKGVIVRTSEFKSFNVADSLKDFHSSDFSISSLASVGALPKLRTTYMPFPSSLSLADSFHEVTTTIANYEK